MKKKQCERKKWQREREKKSGKEDDRNMKEKNGSWICAELRKMSRMKERRQEGRKEAGNGCI